jgi:hypothetical protein
MKTTIEIRDALLLEAREAARKEGTTLRALVEEGLRLVVRRRGAARPPFRLRRVVFRGDGLRPGVRLEDWGRIRGLAYEGRGG